jgi:hypothetical protein
MRQQANLRVRVLGVLDVAVDGHEVAPIELASRKGRTLLRLLLARRGVVVPAEVLPVEAAAGQAEGALAARLLVEDETGAGYRFVNDLVREVLYATSPRPTRVARHRRLAGLLADRPETAAGHAAAAGDWAAAARAWMAAAATAARSYANRDAERLLGQAVEAATRPGDPALEAAARLDPGPGPGRPGRLPGGGGRPGAGPGAGHRKGRRPAGGGRPGAARLDRLLQPATPRPPPS